MPSTSSPSPEKNVHAAEGATACLSFDRQMRYTLWSSTLERESGISAERVLGRVAPEVLPFLAEVGEEEIYRRVLGGDTFPDMERPCLVIGCGCSGTVRLSYYPLFDCEGSVTNGLAVIERGGNGARPERRELHKRIKTERAFLKEVMRQMPAGVVIARAATGRLILSNRQMEEIWRRPFPDLAGMEADFNLQGYHADGRAYRFEDWPITRSATNGESVMNEEIEILRGDGTRGVILANSAPVRDRAGKIIAAVMTNYDITERKYAELLRSRFKSYLQDVREEERRRLARELHDEAGQELTAISMRLELLRHKLAEAGPTDAAVNAELEELAAILRTTHQSLRRLAHALHPYMLEQFGLLESLRALSREVGGDSGGVKLSFAAPGDLPRLHPNTEISIYRVAQEALNNAFKHARPRAVGVRLEVLNGQVVLTVKDDGRGFDSSRGNGIGGIGFASMYERADAAGGKLEVTSSEGEGTEVTLRVPYVGATEGEEVLFLLSGGR